ncbi:MAG: hypothetical protein HRU19_02250 [Pseudobacteriovorax sp.]|nr:hypothetical protein [Pseudobacteriovorax sp.]
MFNFSNIDEVIDRLMEGSSELQSLLDESIRSSHDKIKAGSYYIKVLFHAAQRLAERQPDEVVETLANALEFYQSKNMHHYARLVKAWQTQYNFREFGNLTYDEAIDSITSLVEEAFLDNESFRMFDLKLIGANIAVQRQKMNDALRWLESIDSDLSDCNFFTKSMYLGTCGITFAHLGMLPESTRSFEQLLNDSRSRFFPTLSVVTSVNLTENYVRMKQYKLALALIEKSRHLKGLETVMVADFYFASRTVMSLLALKKLNDVLPFVNQTLKSSKKVSYHVCEGYLICLHYLVAVKKWKRCLPIIKRIEDMHLDEFAPEQVLEFLQLKGTVYENLGDLQTALAAMNQYAEHHQSDEKVQHDLFVDAIRGKISSNYTKNHTMFIEQQLNTEIGLKNHTLRQFKKLLFDHQVQEIFVGKDLEETMPESTGDACVICFDIQKSTKIGHSEFHEFFESLFRECHSRVQEDYDPSTRSARAYTIKEMGDGFLCSVGFPFQPVGNIFEEAISLAEDFIEIMGHVSQAFLEVPAFCSIGISFGPITGYFPKFGIKNYELYGDAIILATRYEAMRKEIMETQDIGLNHILILQEGVYAGLPETIKQQFSVYYPERLTIRDDKDATRLFYRVIAGENTASKIAV